MALHQRIFAGLHHAQKNQSRERRECGRVQLGKADVWTTFNDGAAQAWHPLNTPVTEQQIVWIQVVCGYLNCKY